MAEHDPADVEYLARLIAKYPDDWRYWLPEARRAADRMQAKGVKMTTRESPDLETGAAAWRYWHDAATMTPRD